MKHERPTDEMDERAALYALGALTQGEAMLFDAHLREGCPSCRRQVRQFEKAVDILGYGTRDAEPPEYLRDLLSARIEREAQVRVSGPVPPPAVAETRLKHVPATRSAPPARRHSILPWIVSFVFAAAAAGLGYQWRQAEKFLDHSIVRQKELETGAQQEQERLRSQLEEFRSKTQELDQMNAVLANPGSVVIRLSPQTPNSDLSLSAFLDASRNRCIVAGHVGPAPGGGSYRVWYVEPTTKVSAGLLEPDITGHVFKVLDIDPGVLRVVAIMITVEPGSDSDQPTTPPVGLGRIG